MPEKLCNHNQCPNCGYSFFTQPVSGWKDLIFKGNNFQVIGASTPNQFHHYPPYCDECGAEVDQQESIKVGKIILLSVKEETENVR